MTCVRPGSKLKAVTVCHIRGCAPLGRVSWGVDWTLYVTKHHRLYRCKILISTYSSTCINRQGTALLQTQAVEPYIHDILTFLHF